MDSKSQVVVEFYSHKASVVRFLGVDLTPHKRTIPQSLIPHWGQKHPVRYPHRKRKVA